MGYWNFGDGSGVVRLVGCLSLFLSCLAYLGLGIENNALFLNSINGQKLKSLAFVTHVALGPKV